MEKEKLEMLLSEIKRVVNGLKVWEFDNPEEMVKNNLDSLEAHLTILLNEVQVFDVLDYGEPDAEPCYD